MNDKQTIALELTKALIIANGLEDGPLGTTPNVFTVVSMYESVLRAINNQWPSGVPS